MAIVRYDFVASARAEARRLLIEHNLIAGDDQRPWRLRINLTRLVVRLTLPNMSIQCVDVERRVRVLNLRVSDRQRTVYERAAALEGISVSALVTAAADARADEVLRAHASMTVPTEVFDGLLAALDRPASLVPPLEKALDEPRYQNR
jgi:uncharacterized protein (DUF1778 family)